jgi:hypothetical protein
MAKSKSNAVPAPMSDKKREAEYRAEEDLRTMTRAHEVMEDRTRMHGVRKMHRKQLRAMSRVGRAIDRR